MVEGNGSGNSYGQVGKSAFAWLLPRQPLERRQKNSDVGISVLQN